MKSSSKITIDNSLWDEFKSQFTVRPKHTSQKKIPLEIKMMMVLSLFIKKKVYLSTAFFFIRSFHDQTRMCIDSFIKPTIQWNIFLKILLKNPTKMWKNQQMKIVLKLRYFHLLLPLAIFHNLHISPSFSSLNIQKNPKPLEKCSSVTIIFKHILSVFDLRNTFYQCDQSHQFNSGCKCVGC